MDYVSAGIIVVVVTLSLYFLLTVTNREGEPEFGVRGGESEADSLSATGDHAERAA